MSISKRRNVVKSPHPALSQRERGKAPRRKVVILGVREEATLTTFECSREALLTNIHKQIGSG